MLYPVELGVLVGSFGTVQIRRLPAKVGSGVFFVRFWYLNGWFVLGTGFSYMTQRYFCPLLPAEGGVVPLSTGEAAHATAVMRVSPGDDLELFDGQGNQARARVESVSKRDCVCFADSTTYQPKLPNLEITMGIALPKGDRAKDLIQRLTELGVHRVVPVIADRTQRPPSDSVLEKLSRMVVEACKQSGRNQLMPIDAPVRSDDLFRAGSGSKETRSTVCLIAHVVPHAGPRENIPDSKRFHIAIGPEGGWTDREFELATQHGYGAVELGQRILRVETAAMALAARLLIDLPVS